MSAVQELQNVGFSDAITVERLLQDFRSRSALENKILVLDEAGMLSSRQMSELLRLVEQHSARAVFCGDTRQIRSVEAGDALHLLEKESRLKSIALTEVQRQNPKSYRETIEELRRNPERGFDKLESIGAHRGNSLERSCDARRQRLRRFKSPVWHVTGGLPDTR